MHRFAPCARVVASSISFFALAGPLAAQLIEFAVPTANSRPYTIVAGPDGNMWFTESVGNKIGRITPLGTITEFPVPTAASGPYGITVGRDGNIWFTERYANQIAKLDIVTGQIQEYPIPTWDSQPWKIALGADGLLWFTEENMDQLGNIDVFGTITEFPMGTIGCCFPTGIAAGPSGNLWYTLEIGDQIGQIQPGPLFTQFTIPSIQVLPWDIAPGPDGNMWFTELSGRAVGQITPQGGITEFPIAGAFSGIAGITTGSDGNLYFTENDTHQVSGMTTAGNVFQTWPTSDRPLSICAGSDGNLWFTVADGNKIGRWQLAQPGTQHVLSMDTRFVPQIRNARLGETVQWSFTGPSTHSVSDATGLGLFASGAREPVSFYSYSFPAAGAFLYKDISQAFSRGAINVRVNLPAVANVGVPFSIGWAIGSMPTGFIEDLIVLTPGAPGYVNVVSSSGSGTLYTPNVSGQYLFRARMRNLATGNASAYSRPAAVTVP